MRRVFIANRGEIALRIQRACTAQGLDFVQAYSSADRDSLPVRRAPKAVCVGAPAPAASYLNAAALLAAATATGCDAIHPGYGFLSEQPEFAAASVAAGLTFVGPPADVMARLGSKTPARDALFEVGFPVREMTVIEPDTALDAASLTYPALVKAAAGGGGRGMVRVDAPDQLPGAVELARAEALAAFGDGTLFAERWLEAARHVEIQVLVDESRGIALGSRDCSLQRRFQKIIEEAPAPAVPPELLQATAAACANAAHALGYRGVGTFEFLFDGDEMHFLEVNTRLQVEHPVTEMIYGVDLVAEQLRVAAGEGASADLDTLAPRGHAVEVRINAEDPVTLQPAPGRIGAVEWPAGPGIRIDSHAFPGALVPPHYDALVAKIIAWGTDRETALRRMAGALGELKIRGLTTNAPLVATLVERLLGGATPDTNYVERMAPIETGT